MLFSFNGHNYQTGKLSAIDAYHIARRYAMPLYSLGVPDGTKTPDHYARGLVVAGNQIPQADADFVIDKCLAITTRQQTSGWAPIAILGKGLMFQDIDLLELMVIVFNVLEDNKLFDFFSVIGSTSEEAAPTSS